MEAVPRRPSLGNRALGGGSRYELLCKIATGGTATVYVGRTRGSVGFSRLVAIKRAHPHLREDARARAALIREATLASRIHHANVVPVLDVEESDDELLLVMEYIEGGALSDLLEGERLALPIALRIVLDACAGLAAVHALAGDDGRELGLVHRDVSPQNILVGVDGTARLTDFGLARIAEVSASVTATVKGKIAYMAPEYLEGGAATQASDVFSMGVVVWEALAGERLFRGGNDGDTLRRVATVDAPPLAEHVPGAAALDPVLRRALAKRPEERQRSLGELAAEITTATRDLEVATHAEVGRLVRTACGRTLARRSDTLRAMTDPENATGSVLLDELPLRPSSNPISSQAISSQAISSLAISSLAISSAPPAPSRPPPPPRDDHPTLVIAAPTPDEPEGETLRLSATRSSDERPPSLVRIVLPVTVALATGAVVAWFWPGDAPAKRLGERREAAIAAPLVHASAEIPVPPPPSPPTSSSEPSARPAPHPQKAPPPLPRNPYKDRLPRP